MLKIGVIGYGNRINGIIRCLRDIEPELQLAGIVDPDEAGVRNRLFECDKKNARFFKDIREMVKAGKPDALAIGTRCNLHAQYAMEASKYDLPLFLEKPVSISMEQAFSLEKAFEKSKCRVLVSFPLRLSPLCEMTRNYLAKGSIGEPVHIMASNYVNYGTVYWEQGYRDFKITQGLFLQKATHDLDYIMYLMDAPITRVAAMATKGKVFGGDKKRGLKCSICNERESCLESPANRRRNKSGGTMGDHNCVFSVDCGSISTGTNEDASSVLFEFASGAHGVYTQNFFARRDAAKRGSIISGYQGTLDFDWYRNELKYVRHHSPFSDVIMASEGMSHFGGDMELADNFVSMVKYNAPPKATIWHGIQSVYACLAAKESEKSGKFVEVRQVGNIL
jgi:predicted dehydrogenase